MMADECGKHRHCYALRHFAGSAWLQACIALPEVSRLLGHANMQVADDPAPEPVTQGPADTVVTPKSRPRVGRCES
jgi:hypothetical protein